MKLRTELEIKNQLDIDPFGGMVFLGSCFSDNIGGKIKSLGLPSVVNPFGVIFHPLPLIDILEKVSSDEVYAENDLLEHEGKFYSLNHHGSFSGNDKKALLSRMNQSLSELRSSLEESKLICLTLGTAWGYEYEERLVANCHKLPQKLFSKKLTSVEQLSGKLVSGIDALQRKFPELKVVLTVSPVRHIKDGIVENSRSKAHLLTAVHSAVEELSNVSYFPAYELVMDDLRDYRFYKKDLIHPSDVAVDFVYENFKKFSFTKYEIFTELEKFGQFRSHKVMTSDYEEAQKHENSISQKLEMLNKKYPKLKLV